MNDFNDFREITIEDQELIAPILKRMQPIASEFTFPYLYSWRKDYNLRFGIFGNHLCLVTNPRTAFPYAFCPIPVEGQNDAEGFRKALDAIESHFREQHFDLAFARVEESRVKLLTECYGDKAEVSYLPQASDYVYNADDLINLSGKKYSRKRNHISQFMRYFPNHEYIPVGPQNIDECMRVFDEWCEKSGSDCVHPDNCERLACRDLLENWERFGLKGGLVRVDGKAEAFTIGEKLSDETAAVRVEKGNVDIHGIYAYINREFCAREWSGMKYINREEDLGLEGLRKAKESYFPAFMVKKYLIRCHV
jgi:Uncharacterized conserved protein (DUF2156).